jgi:hypothetical protein
VKTLCFLQADFSPYKAPLLPPIPPLSLPLSSVTFM